MAGPNSVTGLQAALAALQRPLRDLGFRKRSGAVFTMQVSEDQLGWIGLNDATEHMRPGAAEVNPVVGVRHDVVEMIVAELRAERPHPYNPPTVSTPLGYVMPEPRYRAWFFAADMDNEPVADELSTAIADHGLLWMRSFSDLDMLRIALEKGLGHGLEYRLPVVLALLGRTTDALMIVENTLAKYSDVSSRSVDDLRRFARSFRQRAAAETLIHAH